MVKNMRKMKGAALGSPVYGLVDEADAKMRLKHQSLLQDFAELQKETKVTKKRLQKAKQKKQTLLAEVRFLRRRYKFLVKNPSRESSLEALIPPQNPGIQREFAAKQRNYSEKDSIVVRPSTNLDLSEVSLPRPEEELQVAWEPLKRDKKLKYSTPEVAAPARNLNLSICRDVGNGSNRTVKRRVSWQDQVALRV